jgi:hypothetical protein
VVTWCDCKGFPTARSAGGILEARLSTVERRKQNLQMQVLICIEKKDWHGARRLSVEIGFLSRIKVKVQESKVTKLPLFSKVLES